MTPPPAAASAAPGRTRTRPVTPRPRRVSGPARRARPAPRRDAATGIVARLESAAAGRRWIAMIALALFGIVVLQLIHLQLTHGTGVAIERQELLQRQDAALSIEDSELSSGQHVQYAAQRLGMVPVPNGALHIVSARGPLLAGRAVAALQAPSPAPPPPASTESETAAPPAETEAQPQSTPAGTGEAAETQAPSGAVAPATEQQTPSAPTAGGGESQTDTGGGSAAPGG